MAALSGDHHSLPTTMASVALRDDNWHVHHLGADLPPDEILKFCRAQPVSLAVITVTNPTTGDLADTTAAALRAPAHRRSWAAPEATDRADRAPPTQRR